MRANRYSVGALTLLVAAATWGCGRAASAPGAPGIGLARTAIPGLTGRRCEFVSAHDELPSFAALARPGTRGNIALLGYHAAPTDTVVLSVRYDVEGRLAWVRAIRSSLRPDAVAALEGLLLSALYERGPADWGMRLSVIGGELSAAEPSIRCPVEVDRGGGRMAIAGPVAEREFRAIEQVRGRRVPVQVTVDDQGRIMDVRLARSTGQAAVDQLLIDWVRATRFRPKLHDGIALAGTLEQEIYIPRRR